MTSVLKYIPMPVLYGVFMYMGTAPLSEMDFYHRIKLFFMPAKYQPDHIYIRKVSRNNSILMQQQVRTKKNLLAKTY